MSATVDMLVEMGFTKQKAELAISKSGSNDIQQAMEWLLAHQDDIENLPEETPAQSSATHTSDSATKEAANEDLAPPDVVKSIRCDDCNKLFKTPEEVEFHASKSGHANFSESAEEKQPLSEEERREQIAKIEAKLRERRLQREAHEKEEALLREKNRIKSGKELLELKSRQEELEVKKIVEEKKREKEEERKARQRVRDQIEQDKLARKAKFGGGAPVSEPQPVVVAKPVVSKPAVNYNEAKIQIKLTNGATLCHTFGAKEPLSAVRLFVEMNRTDTEGPFGLMTTFPRRVFTVDDFEKPLDTLDLAPSATLTVCKE